MKLLFALYKRIISLGVDEETPKQMAATVRLANFIAFVGGINTLPLIIGLLISQLYIAAAIISVVIPGYLLTFYYNSCRRFTVAKVWIALSVEVAFGLFVWYSGNQISIVACFLLHICGTTLLLSNRSERKVFTTLIVFELLYLSVLLLLADHITPSIRYSATTIQQVQVFIDISCVYLNIAILLYFLSLFYAREKVVAEANVQLLVVNAELDQSNQQLLALSNEKSELMNIVAHDLQNPINVVHGLAELINSNYAPPEQVPDIIHQIIQTSERMSDLVKNLLDSNRLESGTLSFNLIHLSVDMLVATVENVLRQYQSNARRKNITLHIASEIVVSTVLVDEQAMIQVLDNLISNAVKYSPHGKNVFVRVLSKDATVQIEVQDEGQGISYDDMKMLFGKFARLSTRPTGGEHSTGLGLSIVKKMVEAMNGRVWCESEIGKGATFIVELPSAPNGTMT